MQKHNERTLNYWGEEISPGERDVGTLATIIHICMTELSRRGETIDVPIIVHIDGGLVQGVYTDLPIDVTVMDTDLEGADPEDVTNDYAVCSLQVPEPILGSGEIEACFNKLKEQGNGG